MLHTLTKKSINDISFILCPYFVKIIGRGWVTMENNQDFIRRPTAFVIYNTVEKSTMEFTVQILECKCDVNCTC